MALVQFDLAQDFPVGLDRLWTALGCSDYIEQKYRSLGSTSLRLQQLSVDANSIEIRLERRAPVALDELPVWARILSGKQQAMRHHTRWKRTGPHSVEVVIEIHAVGLPVDARALGSVVELAPGHSRMTLHFGVSSSAPALPSEVAQLFARQVKRALEADHAFTLRYLGALSREEEGRARTARTNVSPRQ